MDEIVKLLIAHHISAKEAEVYVALVQMNHASASGLAKKIDKKRLETYNVLQSLIRSWLVSTYMHGKVSFFSPLAPELLIQRLKTTYEQWLAQLPQLHEQFAALATQSTTQTRIEHFSGVDAIKSVYDRLLDSNDMCVFVGTAQAKAADIISYVYETHIPERIARGARVQLLLSPNAYARYMAFVSSHPVPIVSETAKCVHEDHWIHEHTLIIDEQERVYLFAYDVVPKVTILHDRQFAGFLREMFQFVRNKSA